MSNQTALNEIYHKLSEIGVVDTRKEFYEDWLNRSEGYLRALKHSNKQPSADALAICSSKLKHYSRLLTQRKGNRFVELATLFNDYSYKLDVLITENSKTKWMDMMEKKAMKLSTEKGICTQKI